MAVALIVGTLSLIIGIFGFFFVPRILGHIVSKQTHLGRNADGTDNQVLKMFRNPPYDVKLQVWTFSVQNPAEVVSKGEMPKLVEKGPYTYNVQLHKEINFTADDSRLFFRQLRSYSFEQSLSCPNCNLTDRVTVPNILMQKIVDIIGDRPYLRMIVEGIVKSYESFFINLSVDELLFEGYEDKLIKKICSLPFIKSICKKEVPERIGLFYGQNNTDDGVYEVDSGLRGVELLDRVYSWNNFTGSLEKSIWYGDPARMINGTDAELYPPNLYSQENLQIFIGQLCRSFDLEKRDATTTSGIPIFRYSQADSFLDVATQRSQGFCNPKSPAYFNSSVQEIGCAPSGLLDMSSCLPGNPRILWSASHFRNTATALRLDGMAAPSDADLSFFDIEPITGAVVGVKQRSQLNLGMLNGNFGFAKEMKSLVVPIIWINESAIIDPQTRSQLLVPVETMFYSFAGGLGLIVFGLLSLVCFAGLFIGFRLADRRRRIQSQTADDDPHTPLVTAEERPPPPAQGIIDFQSPHPQAQVPSHY